MNLKYIYTGGFFLTIVLILFSSTILIGCNDKSMDRVEIKNDTVKIAASRAYHKNFIHNFLCGTHYRNLWALKVSIPVIEPSLLDSLTVIKQGGNFQTTSLHVKSKDDRRYVLRGVDKDLATILPVFFRTTILTSIVRDQTSASNPYAALITDDLAEATGIHHTNPVYYYIPENVDPSFKALAGKLVLFEEKPGPTWKKSPTFANADKILETEDLLELIYTNSKVSVDQEQYLRSRLFDIWVNDWDRHAGQWAWLKLKSGDSTYYQPLPRDRDNAFYMFDDGFITFLISKFVNTKFQSFHTQYDDISGIIKNSVYLDHYFLNRLDWPTWKKITEEFQQRLTDDAIISSVKKWPPEVYNLYGESTIKKLKNRRKNLMMASREFYKLNSQTHYVAGTDQAERILIRRLPKQTVINMYSKESGKLLYNYTIQNAETKELVVYALKGEDEILISGNVKKGIKITIYGGEDTDTIKDESSVAGHGKKTSICDAKDGNKIDFGTEATDNTSSDDKAVYKFNRSGERTLGF